MRNNIGKPAGPGILEEHEDMENQEKITNIRVPN